MFSENVFNGLSCPEESWDDIPFTTCSSAHFKPPTYRLEVCGSVLRFSVIWEEDSGRRKVERVVFEISSDRERLRMAAKGLLDGLFDTARPARQLEGADQTYSDAYLSVHVPF